MSPVLEVRSIAGGYGDLRVVRDVTLSVQRGKITALLGRNGAGKTTTLRLISGLNRLESGEVLLDGRDVSRLSAPKRARSGLAYVQEGKRVFRERTVRENIVLGTYAERPSGAQLAARVDEAFERFPALAAKRDSPAGLLSGGQQQMLAIAQALAARPRVLMLDEPTTGLAPTIVDELFDLVQALRSEGLGVLLVEQAVDFSLGVADDAVVINLGGVVFRGAADAPDVGAAVEAAYMGAHLGRG
ncbi:ATP-binding cassette domain-containing protein [Actinomadura sp. LD22]|uniref:ATP-binding cassette domain-containing protein n=1 Tax=Actinomadura physcomitrii TaxID=2650748 RepID=A0A6I4MBW0_9ACTN|nr:ABC transporter ATP-binding protein [Actinomadura physcomitrii]MWA03183.1 ATP-binding cassette domain-containing protein [Actinomadura physcomitrii]